MPFIPAMTLVPRGGPIREANQDSEAAVIGVEPKIRVTGTLTLTN